jgi:CubicO group peptidase (beta-lactamase class C family)
MLPVLLIAGLSLGARANEPVNSGQALVESLISALNSSDPTTLKTFAERYCDTTIPPGERAKRLASAHDQGAPFKLVRMLPSQDKSVAALIQDKQQIELGLKLELSADPNPKIVRMMIAPAEALNAPPPKDYKVWQDLAELTESVRKDTDNPAMAVAIIRQGQPEQAVKGTRTANGNDAVTPDEPWSIGSIGKPICSTIIGHLIELGKLRWDTTLGEAFKGWPMKEGYRQVTIEQIMHHRGGIPQDLGMRRPEVDRIVAGATDRQEMRKNYAKDIFSRDPIGKAGERFAYSNAGYALLGVIAETAMSQSYEDLVREMVFQPLNLKNSYTAADTLPKDRPSGHIRGPQGLEVANFSGPIEILYAPAGGGQFMSVADLATFGKMHLDGLRGKDGLLKASTIKRLHQGIAETGNEQRQYACGWGLEQHPGIETMHAHNGSNGTMRAQLSIFPESDLVVASFVNAGGETEPSPPLQAALAVASKIRQSGGAAQIDRRKSRSPSRDVFCFPEKPAVFYPRRSWK